MNEKVQLVVTRTKAAIDGGSFKPGQVITAKDIINLNPGIWAASVGVVANQMAHAGLLRSLGSKKLEVRPEFADLSLDQCLERMEERPKARKEYTRTPKEQEPAKPGLVTVNFIDGWRLLAPHEIPDFVKFGMELARNEDIPGLVMFGINRLYVQANGYAKAEDRYEVELKKLQDDNDRLRNLLKEERERTMELRTEIGKAKGGAMMGRIADRKITLETTPAPEGTPLPKKTGEMMVEERSLKSSNIIRRHSLDPDK